MMKMFRNIFLLLFAFGALTVGIVRTGQPTQAEEVAQDDFNINPFQDTGFVRTGQPFEAAKAVADVEPFQTALAAGEANCRYGVAATGGNSDHPFVDELRAGTALNFWVNFGVAATYPDDTDYIPIIRLTQIDDGDGNPDNDDYTIDNLTYDDGPNGLGTRVTQNPGRLWLIGNEVDRIIWQDEIYPKVYARAYHELYHFIKDRDPSAVVSISGLVLVSPGRLQYLDIMMEEYISRYNQPMPVDVWNAHLYILPERQWGTFNAGSSAHIALGTDPNLAIFNSEGIASRCSRDDVHCAAEHDDVDLIQEQVLMMRQWMHKWGQSEKPLLISEYGFLYPFDDYDDPVNPTSCFLQDEFGNCFTEARTINFMNATFNLFETYTDATLGYSQDGGRMVQQWVWFPTFGQEREAYKLVKTDGSALSSVGENFRDQVAARPATTNIKVVDVQSVSAETVGGVANVTLRATLLSDGTTNIHDPFNVVFYSDAAMTNAIGSVSVNALTGCTIMERDVEVSWSGLTAGVHDYYVRVEPTGLTETSTADNVGSGKVFIDTNLLYLPITSRR